MGALGASGSSNQGNVFYGSSASSYGSLEVIYTFTPAAATVPEPSSVLPVVLGLGGVAAVGRGRRRLA